MQSKLVLTPFWRCRRVNRSVARFPPMSAVCDFELSQALDGPPEVDERRPESSSVSMTGNVQGAEEETFQLDRGLDLVVSHSRTGLKRVANLVLAANRMKKLSELCGDAQLCDAIMDDVVQETVVNGSGHATATAAAPAKPVYLRLHSGECCHLLDHAQKVVVKASAGMALQAITLKGGHGERRVNFKMAKYTSSASDGGQTVALSISNSSLHISCSMNGDSAALSLEECSKEDLRMIGADENMKRFLFIKTTRGISLTKFESVKCRGWFISTSSDNDNEPVEMCEVDAVRRCYNFNMP